MTSSHKGLWVCLRLYLQKISQGECLKVAPMEGTAIMSRWNGKLLILFSISESWTMWILIIQKINNSLQHHISLLAVGPKLEAPPTMQVPVGLEVWSLSAGASTSVIWMLGMVRGGFRAVLGAENKQKRGWFSPCGEMRHPDPTPPLHRKHSACARLGTSPHQVIKDLGGLCWVSHEAGPAPGWEEGVWTEKMLVPSSCSNISSQFIKPRMHNSKEQNPGVPCSEYLF